MFSPSHDYQKSYPSMEFRVYDFLIFLGLMWPFLVQRPTIENTHVSLKYPKYNKKLHRINIYLWKGKAWKTHCSPWSVEIIMSLSKFPSGLWMAINLGLVLLPRNGFSVYCPLWLVAFLSGMSFCSIHPGYFWRNGPVGWVAFSA